MRFIDLTGLDSEISRLIHKNFYENFSQVSNINEADIALCGNKPIEIPSNIKYIACNMTNINHIKYDKDSTKIVAMNERPAYLYEIRSTAEHTFYLIMSLFKRKSRSEIPGLLLNGKTLLIIGHGRVGHQVEEIAKAFKMNVLTYDLNSTSNLNILIGIADIISVHISVSKDQCPVINKDNINFISDEAFIINTSRPQAVDNIAIIDNINRLGGFASDFRLPWELESKDNVFVTDHTGGYTFGDMSITSELCFKKLMEELRCLK